MTGTEEGAPNRVEASAEEPVGSDDGDIERARVRAHVRQRLFGGPVEPVRVGRFEILERIGSGAMGVVYQARDPELDRIVALKLLHPSTSDHAVDARTKMLLREARAMAKLAHPNVVTVHEVGTFEGRVFIAMERVDGGTLRQWMERENPAQERLLAVLVEAGRGLAAAHAQGLVHRDFKLDNVLIGEDGRPRIGDFGLVKPSQRPEEQGPDSMPATRRGAVVGTPAYMAPEQLRGEPADDRSDQFSFCVSIVECFAGERPFVAATIEGLNDAIQQGLPKSALTSLPPGVARVVQRGLQVSPKDRYPSMDALLDDLNGPGRPQGRSALWVAGGVLLVAVAGLLVAYTAKWPAFAFAGQENLAAPAIPAMPKSRAFIPHVAVDITRLCVSETRASSHLKDHPASLAFDGLSRTAWTESAKGDGTGAWVEARFRPGTWVSDVRVRGGWASRVQPHGVDLWEHNNSFRKMRVSWQGGEANATFDRKQDRGVAKRVRVDADTPAIRFTAVEVDRGRFDDLCLDEIVIRGYCD
jgi:predicted Ser/Thr protein kinase